MIKWIRNGFDTIVPIVCLGSDLSHRVGNPNYVPSRIVNNTIGIAEAIHGYFGTAVEIVDELCFLAVGIHNCNEPAGLIILVPSHSHPAWINHPGNEMREMGIGVFVERAFI